MKMQRQTRLALFSYIFVACSLLFWYRADLAFRNGLFMATTNMQLVFDFFALFPHEPTTPGMHAAPLIPITEASLMYLLAALAALSAASGLYCSGLGYKMRVEPRWYAIPAVLSIVMIFLSIRLVYWAYTS